ncbi:hypothetical protein QQS21_005352 [Conoideocrella luteorostrata]|uniref:Uncharacterized protein n=1 Tax=Conoideocrella luteorostrata TaxID=1105319 RepID=A0AAJ0CPV3_9HYPO|nr:hypothetical protein QQS21_005352 [Conoideocrella luteorostrata]
MWNLKTAAPDLYYSQPWYSGPAMRLGAGLTGGEAHKAAAPLGYRIVGGECGSVSIAGGWSQGGGHSILSSAYGMGAYQVLEWEVVMAAADDREGSRAVVLSVTVKMHRDGPIGGGSLSFANNGGNNNASSAYWRALVL